MARTTTGVEIGLSSNKFLRGFWKGNTFHVTEFAITHHERAEIAEAWAATELSFKPTEAKPFHKLKLPDTIRDMSLHPDGLQVATAHHDGHVRISRMEAKPAEKKPADKK